MSRAEADRDYKESLAIAGAFYLIIGLVMVGLCPSVSYSAAREVDICKRMPEGLNPGTINHDHYYHEVAKFVDSVPGMRRHWRAVAFRNTCATAAVFLVISGTTLLIGHKHRDKGRRMLGEKETSS